MSTKLNGSPEETHRNEEEKQTGIGQKPIDLDFVLVNELGQFGKFQLRNFLLVAVPLIMSAFMSEFIFSAAPIPHRCRIEECGENSKLGTNFEQEWIMNAIPETDTGFSSCQRFPHRGNGNGTLDYCPAYLFNQDETIGCDSFVYARDNSVVYDFDLGCQEWLRALAGTLNSVGSLLVLPITGYISDRFGRRIALVINVFNMALFGLLRAFSVNYPMYLVLQLLQTTLGHGTFSSAYIIVAELVGPKYRVVMSATSTVMFALGQMTLGAVAWLIQPWRYMIIALHAPCFLIISYYWILSESVRWLLSKQKYEEAKELLLKVARVNGTTISDKSLEALTTPPTLTVSDSSDKGPGLISKIIKSRVLLRRVCTTPIWWMTTTFIYYGLSINSTGLSDTMYLNYILTVAIEMPGAYTSVYLQGKIGRKPTLSIGFFLCAVCNIAFAFISRDMATPRLVVYMAGKFGISVAFTTLYLYTSELYPTQYRHTLLAFSSMLGRLGSITAPLTPALMMYWEGIPSLLFGSMGLLSGLLVLTQPETLGTKLPDTLDEAEALGR